MLMPRILIASAVAWCVAGITAGTLRTSWETAPAPAAASPEPVLVEILHKADRLPLAPNPQVLLAQAFAEQTGPARAEPVATIAPPPAIPAPQTEPEKLTRGVSRNPTPHFSHPRDVCTRHGMHRVVTHGGRSWRCRR